MKFIYIKKLFLFFLIFFITSHAIAQSGIFFQAIARDRNANPAKDRKLYVQTNIIQSSPTGTIVLTEEHETFTDAFGIFSIMVGSGRRVGGTVTGLSTIDWSKGPYYLNLKIVITPVTIGTGWDYNKEWVDIGTTIFGAVPFALYSANTANINNKLNAADTTKMLESYAKVKAVQVLSTSIDTKLATKDTATMLAPYAKKTYTDSALLTKMNVFDKSIYAKQAYVDTVNYIQQKFVDSSLQSKFNLTDTLKYTKQIFTDSALLTKMNVFDKSIYAKQAYVDSALLTKMNNFDTSRFAKQIFIDSALITKFNNTDTIKYTKLTYTDSALSTKFKMVDTINFTKQIYTDSALLTKMNFFDTTRYAKQAYVDSINYIQQKFVDSSLQSKFNLADTIKYTKQTFTDSALLTKLTTTGSAVGLTNFPILNQNTTGNAAFATTATTATTAGTSSTATKLAIARKINNVAFDGSADITITADAGTLTGATLNSTVTNSSLTSVGTLTNTIISGKLVVGATSAASNSAVLEASSTTQGFLPPRMTTIQRDAILSPATGLVIFNTTTNGLEVKSSNGWVLLTPSTAVSLPTVVIGTQQWTDKNLDVLTYRNGDLIPQVTDPTAWAALTTGAWCYFNNDPSGYGSIYGKLYNWYAVNDPRGLAPQGWHIATSDELATLRTTLGGSTVAGAKMKTTTRWTTPNPLYKGAGATNESGFSGLPGSYRDSDGSFFNFIGQEGYWWTATEFNTTIAYHYQLGKDFDNAVWGKILNKKRGFSVRCVRD